MIRLFAALVCFGALPLAVAAPVPTHLIKDPPLYYPVTKGTHWVYLEDNAEHQYEVAEVEKSKQGNAFVVNVVEVEGENRTLYRKMEVSRSGLLWLETTGGAAFDEPIPMLRCPVVERKAWRYRCSGGETIGKFEGTMTVVGYEQVEVPAGKFDAVRVKDEHLLGGEGTEVCCTNTWFAPGVGLVKADYGTHTWVLKSFVPGK